MDIHDHILVITFLAILLAPAIGYVLLRILQWLGNKVTHIFVGIIIILLVIFGVGVASGISFVGITFDFAFFAAVWSSIAFLVWWLKNECPNSLGRILGHIGLLLISMLSVLTLLVGGLALAFALSGYEPVYETTLENGYNCRIKSYGNATTSTGGYIKEMIGTIPFIPFLEYIDTSEQYESYFGEPHQLCDAS